MQLATHIASRRMSQPWRNKASPHASSPSPGMIAADEFPAAFLALGLVIVSTLNLSGTILCLQERLIAVS